jgi:excisionase family DNA binding protein
MALYLTVGGLARELGVAARTVDRWIAAKTITPAWRTLGGHARSAQEQAEALNRFNNAATPRPGGRHDGETTTIS